MQKLLAGMALVAAAAFGVTLDELNVARDPEGLDNVIYGTTIYNMNLRAGPGEHFAVLGTVPGGTKVPVLGWISDRLREGEFWIRTEYKGQRGWLCGFKDAQRLIEKDAGPLFPMEVKARELLFEYNKEGTNYPWYEAWLRKGDKIEFASLWRGSWLGPRAGHIAFWVKHGGVWGNVCAYATEEFVREAYEPFVKGVSGEVTSGWFVDFPPEFLALSFDYNYDTYSFEFADGAAYPKYYLGPGFEYGEANSVFMHAVMLFIEEPWALVLSWNDWSWVFLGTIENPNVELTTSVGFKKWKEFPVLKSVVLEDVFSGFDEGDGKRVSLYYYIWPASNALYIRFSEPYFSPYIDKVAVRHVDLYQPPANDTPVYSGPPAAAVDSGWHETVILTYPVELPAGFDFEAPFKMEAKMVYDEAEEFTLTFDCNTR